MEQGGLVATATVSNMTSAKSFSAKKPPVEFDIDGEPFRAYRVLPARQFAEFAEKVSLLNRANDGYTGNDKINMSMQETITVVLDAIELCLDSDSTGRLAARINDPENPVDIATMTEMLVWLLEQMGMVDKSSSRPPQPTSDSPTGSEATGVGSAESASSTVEPPPLTSDTTTS
jgi:hypothetical protein